jgi:hypothetical protein
MASAQEAMDGSPALVTRSLAELRARGGKFSQTNPAAIPGPDVDPTHAVITIKFQVGPIREVGLNGCSIEDVIDVLAERVMGFQRGPFMCLENEVALRALNEAKGALLSRTAQRQAQGVEGTNQPHLSPAD